MTPSSEQSAWLVGPAPLVLPLLLDGPLGKGLHLESLVRDRYPALDRSAVRASCDALLGAPYGGEMLAEVGPEGGGDQLRVESTADLSVLSGLLAREGSFATALAALLGERRFNTRSLPGNEFTGPWLVHDHLLAGSIRPLAWRAAIIRRFGLRERLDIHRPHGLLLEVTERTEPGHRHRTLRAMANATDRWVALRRRLPPTQPVGAASISSPGHRP